jgi:hypothetical protein
MKNDVARHGFSRTVTRAEKTGFSPNGTAEMAGQMLGL